MLSTHAAVVTEFNATLALSLMHVGKLGTQVLKPVTVVIQSVQSCVVSATKMPFQQVIALITPCSSSSTCTIMA